MTFLLLTGAGFSHNWGGPLASEVFNSVLADKDIDDHSRELLFASDGAFETVLADLQASTDPSDQKRHDALITSVAGIFNDMNNTFMHVQFEFESPPSVRYSMASFLSRFHAIFTLNQDALIEQHYNPMLGPPMNWVGCQLPGMRFMQPFQPSGARQDKFALMEPNPPFKTLGTSSQPYVKLHGSVNWVESNMGKRILIMGGQKAVSIGHFPILQWYHDEFRKMVLRPEARLMIIGYGFGDNHINDAIADGMKAGLRLFVVDPYALVVIKKDSRIEGMRNQIIGLSTRPLKGIFGGDRYGHAELSRFFA